MGGAGKGGAWSRGGRRSQNGDAGGELEDLKRQLAGLHSAVAKVQQQSEGRGGARGGGSSGGGGNSRGAGGRTGGTDLGEASMPRAFTLYEGRRYYHGKIRDSDWQCAACGFPTNWDSNGACYVCKSRKSFSHRGGSARPGAAASSAAVGPTAASTTGGTATTTTGLDEADQRAARELPLTAKALAASTQRPPQSIAVVALSAEAAACAAGAASAGTAAGAAGGVEGDQELPSHMISHFKAMAECTDQLGALAREKLLQHNAAVLKKKAAADDLVADLPKIEGCSPLQASFRLQEHLSKVKRLRADAETKQATKKKERLEEQQKNEAALVKQIEAQRELLEKAESELKAYTAIVSKDAAQWAIHDAESLKAIDERIRRVEAELQKAEAARLAAGDAADLPAAPSKGDATTVDELKDVAVGASAVIGDGGVQVGGECGQAGSEDQAMNFELDDPLPAVKPFLEPPAIAVKPEDHAKLLQMFSTMSQWRQQGVEFPLTLSALSIEAGQLRCIVGEAAWAEFYSGEAVPSPMSPLDRRLLGILDTALMKALLTLQTDSAAQATAQQAASKAVHCAATAYSEKLKKKHAAARSLVIRR